MSGPIICFESQLLIGSSNRAMASYTITEIVHAGNPDVGRGGSEDYWVL